MANIVNKNETKSETETKEAKPEEKPEETKVEETGTKLSDLNKRLSLLKP